MDYALKFRQLREHFNLTQTELGNEIGISRAVISQIEINKHKPTLEILTLIIKKFDIDIKFFFEDDFILDLDNKNGKVNNGNLNGKVDGKVDGKADAKNGKVGDKKGIKVFPEDKTVMQSTGGIPYYELLPATAGNFNDILNTAEPTSYINLPQIEGCTAVLPVYGSSMKGLIEPGDLIAIKELKSRTEFDPSVPYMVITNEHRMIKYLRVDESDVEIIWAESTNHKPIKLEAHNILYVYAIKCVIRFF